MKKHTPLSLKNYKSRAGVAAGQEVGVHNPHLPAQKPVEETTDHRQVSKNKGGKMGSPLGVASYKGK